MIPQDPVLHRGSVAHNLDPFGGCSDSQMEAVLRRARLKGSVTPSTEMAAGGANLSAGERQVMCTACSSMHPTHVIPQVMGTACASMHTLHACTRASLMCMACARHVYGMCTARAALSVTPQDPVLHRGSLDDSLMTP